MASKVTKIAKVTKDSKANSLKVNIHRTKQPIDHR